MEFIVVHCFTVLYAVCTIALKKVNLVWNNKSWLIL